jgi:hypothetical protein
MKRTAHNQRIVSDSHRCAVPAAHAWRVCRAWHKTREVKVLLPGIRRAEG